MANLIVIRLSPVDPLPADDFRTFLNGLEITAHDLTFADSISGVVLGTATGLANSHMAGTTNNNVNINNTAILQHYRDVHDPTVLQPPRDIHLTLSRNGQDLPETLVGRLGGCLAAFERRVYGEVAPAR
jgi:hypothetical protein